MDQRAGASQFDLVFAGGGFSSAITLTYLLRELALRWRAAGDGPGGENRAPIRIAVFDDRGRFPKGLSYAEDEHSSAFLITPASEMMPPGPDGGNALTTWLVERQDLWAQRLERSQNAIVKAWLPDLVEAVETGAFHRAFVPRSVIGWFLEDQVDSAVSVAETTGCARLEIKPLAVSRVQKRPGNGGLLLRTEDGATYETARLVVAIGSGAFGALPSAQANPGPSLITRPLENGVSALRRRLNGWMQAQEEGAMPRVLVIGSNASSLDVVSVLLDLHAEQGKLAQITSISPSGQFPPEYRDMTTAPPDPDPCQALAGQVASKQAPTAQQIYDSAVLDLQRLLQAGTHVGAAKGLIYRHVLTLIGRLSDVEKRAFVEVYGNDLSRKFYMTSPIYAQLYRNAIETGQLNVLSGRVAQLRPSAAGTEVVYDAAGHSARDVFDLVLDCTGFEHPVNRSSNPLLRSLFADLGVRQNQSGRGFKTKDDSFEIAPDVSVIGPLYAGNVDRTGVCRWHLETTRGISEIAALCATDLARGMLGTD